MKLSRALVWSALALPLLACGSASTSRVDAELAVRAEPGAGPALSEVSFGGVPIHTSLERAVHLHSLQPVDLEIGRLRLEGPDAASFAVEPAGPLVVPGLASRRVAIRFSPTAVRLHSATLVIPSNAPGGETRLALGGEGVSGDVRLISCLPSTALEPERCRDTQVEAPGTLDLGEVVEGQQQPALVTIFNDGKGPLQVTDISFRDPTAAATVGFSFLSEVAGPVVVAPLTSVDFRVGLAPVATALGPLTAAIRVATDDPDEPEVDAVLRATAVENRPPEACLAIRQIVRRDGTVVDLGPDDPVPAVETLDRVVLDARVREDCSADPEDGTAVVQEWAVESPGVPPLPAAVDGEPFRRAIVPQVPGTHVVSLAVVDRLGKRSGTDSQGVPATVSFEVVVPRDIGVYAMWPEAPFVDLDLHFVHPSSSLWSDDADGPSDCHWANPSPNWGDPETRVDDPVLVVDDIGNGALVEAVELNDPEPGARYQVHVHFAGDRRVQTGAPVCADDGDCTGGLVCSGGRCLPPVEVAVEVWLDGERVEIPASFRNPESLVEPCDDWFVGMVEWPAAGGAPVFLPAPSGTVSPSGLRSGTTCSPP